MKDALRAQIEAQNELVRLKALSASNERSGRVSVGRSIQEATNSRRSESESRTEESKFNASTGSTARTMKLAPQQLNNSSSDSSSNSSGSSEKVFHSRSPKKRSFAAVNALLGIDEEALSHRPTTRGKRIDRRAHLDFLDFTDGKRHDSDDGSDAEKPLPSQSVLSPPGADPDRSESGDESESDEHLVQSSQFQVRASVNEDWSDGVDIQFPASARLKHKISSKSSAAAFSSSDDVIQTESSTRRFAHGETITTATRREVHWKKETQISGSSEDCEEAQGVGNVDDVLETKWTGFSYTDKQVENDDSDDDAEYSAMKRLAEKNLE